MNHTEKVYLIVHELFGVSIGHDGLTLVTPKATEGHSYQIAQFINGTWSRFYDLKEGATYRLKGVIPGRTLPFPDSCSPCPNGKFSLQGKPFCRWELDFPRKVHRLRLVDIDSARPLFSGKHGEQVDKDLSAISVAQVFEYLPDGTDVEIVQTPKGQKEELPEKPIQPDPMTHTINLHIWAEVGHPHFLNHGEAIKHAIDAFASLADLFSGLEMRGLTAVPTDTLHATQPPMPDGVRFVELMTLSEIIAVKKEEYDAQWTPKTCGVAGNLYVRS